VRGFLSLAIPSGCGNLSERRATEERTTTGPFSEYIKAGQDLFNISPEPAAKFKTRRRNARSSTGSRNGCPANHSSRRINSTAGQATPLAGEAGDVSPPP
jgi:hypothetical protein